MFSHITDKFEDIFRNVRGLGKITDANIKKTSRQVRKTLIDADVNFKVVKSFIAEIEQKSAMI